MHGSQHGSVFSLGCNGGKSHVSGAFGLLLLIPSLPLPGYRGAHLGFAEWHHNLNAEIPNPE